MWKPLIRSSIIGGIVVYLWMTLSWMVLPMHNMNIHTFAEPSEVESCVTRYAPHDGIYMIPSSGTKAQESAKSTFLFVNLKRGYNSGNMVPNIVMHFITLLLASFAITYLLIRSRVSRFWNRVWFVTAIAGIAGLLSTMNLFIWWQFPASWVFLEFFDLLIGWFIGGLVIAKLVKN